MRLVAALIVVLAIVIFAVENTQSVRLTFLGMRFPALRLPVLIFGSVLLGAIAVALIGSFELVRMRRRIAALERDAATIVGALPGPASSPTGPRPAIPAETEADRSEPPADAAGAAPADGGPDVHSEP